MSAASAAEGSRAPRSKKAGRQPCALPGCEATGKLRICSACELVAYCGTDHQVRHAKVHEMHNMSGLHVERHHLTRRSGRPSRWHIGHNTRRRAAPAVRSARRVRLALPAGAGCSPIRRPVQPQPLPQADSSSQLGVVHRLLAQLLLPARTAAALSAGAKSRRQPRPSQPLLLQALSSSLPVLEPRAQDSLRPLLRVPAAAAAALLMSRHPPHPPRGRPQAAISLARRARAAHDPRRRLPAAAGAAVVAAGAAVLPPLSPPPRSPNSAAVVP